LIIFNAAIPQNSRDRIEKIIHKMPKLHV
jgi:hypothetical protein